jgi:PIN domain nuclease of toxin-antitoxin system
MSRVVLDTSALLALCFAENGAKRTQARGQDGLLSAVSYSETIAKSTDYGAPWRPCRRPWRG